MRSAATEGQRRSNHQILTTLQAISRQTQRWKDALHACSVRSRAPLPRTRAQQRVRRSVRCQTAAVSSEVAPRPVRKQELARYTLAELLSELAQAENEALEAEDMPRGAEQEDVRMELERAAGPVLAPRERKAGCKNFFWKTFTSC
ncbi:somatostatin 1, tandem duplicate 1 isoform X1 [Colossoma macropomum]|uniref:somatostatin 1, tandem duplicate 1 isoform X1 n=1 Tax=Colossoma macropomum TaxID=42526 RepID=UPI0018646E67|nr:somatostatin 1, tandem duplicate 1 isoform X1 [Colossoma macropomum]